MKRYSTPLSDEDLASIVESLLEGALAILPTDTLYGFHADAQNLDTIERVYRIKERRTPMSVIAPSFEWFEANTALENPSYFKEKYSGPYTLLSPISSNCRLPNVLVSTGLVGVRFCGGLSADLAERMDRPLITTSVNVTGSPPLTHPDALDSGISRRVDILIDDGPRTKGASTLVDCRQTPEKLIKR